MIAVAIRFGAEQRAQRTKLEFLHAASVNTMPAKPGMHRDAPACTWRVDSAHAAATEDQVTGHAIVPPAIVARLASICLGLPEACEEQAWAGTRWSIRKKNFAHVLMVDAGWPPAYAQAAGSNGPAIVLTFRLPVSRLDAPRFARPPFFRPVWFPDIAGMLIDDRIDWDEVADLLTESYCLLAPRKLVALVDRPSG